MRDFDKWLGEFRPSIASFSYYCDFDKCVSNANKFRNELHLMNALIGQPNAEELFREMAREYPKILMVIPTLLAVRKQEILAQDTKGSYVFSFKRNKVSSIDDCCYLMRETGLFDLISRRLTSNLFDYAIGLEVGLDSNGRKNRGGHLMEDLVESFIADAGLRRVEELRPSDCGVYGKEKYLRDIERAWNVDLSALSADGNTSKRFDFVVRGRSSKCVYLVETNFYSAGGSKLNETARSYKMLALEAANANQSLHQNPSQNQNTYSYRFVWFTDGGGWRSARKNLRETFEVLPTMFNVADLERGICKELFV